jgi:hypothetical protein
MAKLNVTSGLLNWGRSGPKMSDTPTLGSQTRVLWDEQKNKGGGEGVPWKQYKAMVDWGFKERGLEQDWAKHKESEARMLQNQQFQQMVKKKEIELKYQNDVFDDLQSAIGAAEGNLPLQENLLKYTEQLMGMMDPGRRKILQAQLEVGPLNNIRVAQYRAANPTPRHTVGMEDDPVLWAREEFAILDDAATISEIRSGKRPTAATHIPMMKSKGKEGEQGFHMVAVRDPANPHKIDILASGGMGGEAKFGEYITNGGMEKGSQFIDLNGRKVRVTTMEDPLRGTTWSKTTPIGVAKDAWKGHSMKKEIDSLRLDFATEGSNKNSPTRDLYKELVDYIDKTRSDKDINLAFDQLLAPIDNLSIRVRKRKGKDFFSKWFRFGDQLSRGEYDVTFIPGKFRWIDPEKGLGFYYNSSNNSFYDMDGQFMGTEEEVMRILANEL